MNGRQKAPNKPAPYSQRGSALFVLLAILGIAIGALLVGLFKSAAPQNQRDRETEAALARAKDALIGYATAYRETHLVSGSPLYVPGHLPCPDLGTGTEGNEASTCSGKGTSALGRLPWNTLGLPPLRDGNGECLWYAVSGSFKSNTKPDLLNWDSDGQFQVLAEDGSTVISGAAAGTRPVAVIFAPGAPLAGQDRTPSGTAAQCGGNYTPGNYLDTLAGISNSVVSAVANAITQFITGRPSSTFNDRLLVITADDIFARSILKRADFQVGNVKYLHDPTLSKSVLDNPADPNNSSSYALLQKLAQCLVNYGKSNAAGTADKRLPWAAPLNVADFANDTLDDSAGLLDGRPPFRANDSAVSTSSNLVTSTNNYRLLTVNNCPNGWNMVAGNGGTTSQNGWWDKWKDHYFYAVADAFKPTSSVASQSSPCAAGTCLTVDGIGPYAAVLLYAGYRLSGQARAQQSDKTVATNYLEGTNATAVAAGNGTAFTKIIGATANDQLICINQDLTLDPTCQHPVPNGGGETPPGSQVSFTTDIDTFTAGGSQGGSQVTVNPDNSVTLFLTGASNKSACFWFPSVNTLFDTATMTGKTMRTYFKFRFSDITTGNYGDGFTFTVLPGSADVTNPRTMCGDTDHLGYAGTQGGGTPPLPVATPNLAMEFDTYYNSADSDPAGHNHIAFDRDGSLSHGGYSFASPCNGTTRGCYPTTPSTWMVDDAVHEVRLEVQAGCNSTCGTCGGSGSYARVKGWVDCTSCRDLTTNFSGSPSINYCFPLEDSMRTVKFGFTSGEASGNHQTINLSDFGIRFE